MKHELCEGWNRKLVVYDWSTLFTQSSEQPYFLEHSCKKLQYF
jgi:hypothetical protein